MKLYEIVFSPTGGTRKAADLLMRPLKGDIVRVDLADRRAEFAAFAPAADDIAVIAVPSFGGRAPEIAITRLSQIRARGTRAVIVCAYGNRAYEDTLVELADACTAAGFTVIGAVAAIAEHSIVRDIAAGRPDARDEAQLSEFAARIKAKLDLGAKTSPAIPGNRPYKPNGGGGITPMPTQDCVKCALCAQECPVGAIDSQSVEKVDGAKCVSCMRCVAVCPRGARRLDAERLRAVGAFLEKACAGRRENELFI